MPIQFPSYQFNSFLKEYPVQIDEWSGFVNDLLKKAKIPAEAKEKLEIYEYLGVALRITNRLNEAEVYLSKALDLSKTVSKKVQNLIRLADVFLWQKEFIEAKNLFDLVKQLINENDISLSLKASYHQHLGKFYFDQSYFRIALTEFELALNIRFALKSSVDQIESVQYAVSQCEIKCLPKLENIIIRRAQISDAESIHIAHMKSINEICVNEHSTDEIRVWGGRKFDLAKRLPAIQNDFYLIAELDGIVEGFCQLNVSLKKNLKSAHLYGFYITSKILKKHVGDAFMSLVFEYCQCENVKVITLKSTITAFDFYKKYGFIQTGELTGPIRDGVMIRGYPMQKALT
ncbi:MAG: GNAT family N-acetyltransferase [Bdellovibrio sp.]|nr:GNAT family N-acetyltransferase [Bdellovibrio sp.]